MKRSEVFFDLERKRTELAAVIAELSAPETWQDQKKSQSLQQKRKRLEQDASAFAQLEEKKEEVEVLTEGPSRKDPEVATARTRTNKVVHLRGTFPPGQFLDVVVERAAPSHLMARPA